MRPSVDRPSRPPYVTVGRYSVYCGLRLMEFVTALIYIFNFIYLSHFYAKYILDPQLVFMEMFNIGALCKVWIVGVQYGCIALALAGAQSRSPRLLKLPMLFQKIIGFSQLLFSIYCLCCILIGRHDWYLFLMWKGTLQPFAFVDFGWDIGTEEIHFTLAMILYGLFNLFLAHLLASLKDNMINAFARSNAARPFPPAYSSIDRSHNAQGSRPDNSLRNSAVDSYFLIKDDSVVEVCVAAAYVFIFFYKSYSYAKYNGDSQLVFMEMFNISAFYKVMIMGAQFSCMALVIMGALASCPRILSGPIMFQQILGFVQVFFSIYLFSCILNGHRIDWCNILQSKGVFSSSCADQDWGLAGEIGVILLILVSAVLNFAYSRLLRALQEDMQSAPVGSSDRLHGNSDTRYYDAPV